MTRVISGFFLLLLLMVSWVFVNDLQLVEASSTIYIRADGSIDPPTANITSSDNVTYIFTGNNYDEIVVERDNITINGAGYFLQGSGVYFPETIGIWLDGRNNIIIENMRIELFTFGIGVVRSVDNNFHGNIITNNMEGIGIAESSNHNISGNNITDNDNGGITIDYSFNNSISRNNVTKNYFGIVLGSNRTANHNTVFGNKVINNELGIYIWRTHNNSVFGNYIAHNRRESILLSESRCNKVSGNSIGDNERGIRLEYSHCNIISENNVTTNSGAGLALVSSSKAIVSRNLFVDDGLLLSYSYDNVVEDNLVNNRSLVYLEDVSDLAVEDAGQVLLVNCTRIRVENLNLSHTSLGVQLWMTNDTIISGNNISDNDVGVSFYNSSGNRFYHNNIVNNIRQIRSHHSINELDNGYSSRGNYWSDYNGTDIYHGFYQNETGSDGIGDTPYIIDENNTDDYPLVNPWGTGVMYVGNTTITNLSVAESEITFNTEGAGGTTAYVNVTIPVSLNNTNIRVYVDETEILPPPFPIISSNGTYYFVYFGFVQSLHNITMKIQAMPWDITGTIMWLPDGKCDMRDIGLVASLFGSVDSDGTYDARADITGPITGVPDGVIDMRDIGTVAIHFGETDP